MRNVSGLTGKKQGPAVPPLYSAKSERHTSIMPEQVIIRSFVSHSTGQAAEPHDSQTLPADTQRPTRRVQMGANKVNKQTAGGVVCHCICRAEWRQ